MDAGGGIRYTIMSMTWPLTRVAMSDTAVGESTAADRDLALAARAIRGDPGAFGQLYQRHADGVFSYVTFRVRDTALAEDLTHDVWLTALDHIGELRSPAHFRTWLLRIAHHRVLNHWRSEASQPLSADRLPTGIDDDSLQTIAVEDESLTTVAERLDAAGVLAATGRLTDLQQQVIALRFVAGLSLAETATAMDRSVNAVKNLQHHALAALRRHMDATAGDA